RRGVGELDDGRWLQRAVRPGLDHRGVRPAVAAQGGGVEVSQPAELVVVHASKSSADRRLDPHRRSGFRLPGMEDLISIGEFSARSGLSAKRLRSYAGD